MTNSCTHCTEAWLENGVLVESVNELGEKLGTADQGVQNHPYRYKRSFKYVFNYN